MKHRPLSSRPSAGTLIAVLAAALTGIVIGRLSVPGQKSAALAREPGPARNASPDSVERSSVSSPSSTQVPADDWEEFRRQPPTAARDAEAAAWLVRQAPRAPEAALALALAEPHRARRSLWRSAVLRGWAANAPDAAAAWIVGQPASENRGPDIAASFAGAAATPATAFALAKRYAEAFPDRATEHGSLLISALAEAGEFASAARFAAAAGEEQRDVWAALAFSRWSEQQPAAATAAAGALPDPALRDVAWRAAVANWALNEPDSLADYATHLPAGEARAYAFGEALRVWIDQDLPAASRWLDRLDPGGDTDLAVALVATHPALAVRRPDVAISWAESIGDPMLRSRTLARVILAWSNADPVAAARFARSTPALTPADREVALPGERFTPHP